MYWGAVGSIPVWSYPILYTPPLFPFTAKLLEALILAFARAHALLSRTCLSPVFITASKLLWFKLQIIISPFANRMSISVCHLPRLISSVYHRLSLTLVFETQASFGIWNTHSAGSTHHLLHSFSDSSAGSPSFQQTLLVDVPCQRLIPRTFLCLPRWFHWV